MSRGKTIQIFLADGNPKGIKIADLTTGTIQVIQFPRFKLEEAIKRAELDAVGIYFLIGDEEDKGKPAVYVGEAENCVVRLKQQNKSKDFWNTALVAVSKTKYFTKTHIKYLEWYCHDMTQKAGRYILDNTTVPTCPYVSEPIQADLLDSFDLLRVLVSTLGYPIFDQISKPEKKDILFCKGKKASATGEYTEEGLVVFAGSKCNLEESKTAGSWVQGMRKKLLEKGTLAKDGDVFRFNEDHIFSSPSAAAAAILGRRANGWLEWKYDNGKTLDELIRKDK
jgi:hypothetical protein